MCTVTLTPLPRDKKSFILTSNRDEAVIRKTLAPEFYVDGGVKMLFPKDELAGGTWIGLSEKNRAICLLNGGFKKHLRKPPYRKSRGLVVLDFLAANNLFEKIQKYYLDKIEPFTCIMVEWENDLQFFELVWNGKERHLKKLPLKSHIYSSSLLYSDEIKVKKEGLFADLKKKELTAENLLKFHSSEEKENQGLIIDHGFLKTVSITQIVKTSAEVSMIYQNLLKDEKPKSEIHF